MKAPESVESWVPGLAVGPYALLHELARGGMGEIWLARQVGEGVFDRLVVLKRVIGGGSDPSFVTMFLDEARIASQLQHPNVVQVFELARHGDSLYLVMEYLTGQTVNRLARRLHERGERLDPALAVELVAEAARGLGYAHRRKDLEGRPLDIVHRDVSPQNLFVTYDGGLKVLDFGIARAANRLAKTSTGSVKGKVVYMAPEQAASEGVTGAADVFALGVVLFELVTGTRLYTQLDDVQVLRRLISGAPAPRASSRTDVEPELDALIARMLDPDPTQRFRDGVALAEALDAWLTLHPRAETVAQVMSRCFAEEQGSLEEFHRQAVRTPSRGSMPDRPRAQPARRTRLFATAAIAFTVALVGTFGVASLVKRGVTGVPTAATADAGAPTVAAAPVDAGAPTASADLLDAGAPAVAAVPDDAGVPELVGALDVSDAGSAAEKLAKGTGLLTLQTTPWTTVFLGKRRLGDTPLVQVKVPVGTQRLRLVNAEEGISTEVEVAISLNKETRKNLDLK